MSWGRGLRGRGRSALLPIKHIIVWLLLNPRLTPGPWLCGILTAVYCHLHNPGDFTCVQGGHTPICTVHTVSFCYQSVAETHIQSNAHNTVKNCHLAKLVTVSQRPTEVAVIRGIFAFLDSSYPVASLAWWPAANAPQEVFYDEVKGWSARLQRSVPMPHKGHARATQLDIQRAMMIHEL